MTHLNDSDRQALRLAQDLREEMRAALPQLPSPPSVSPFVDQSGMPSVLLRMDADTARALMAVLAERRAEPGGVPTGEPRRADGSVPPPSLRRRPRPSRRRRAPSSRPPRRTGSLPTGRPPTVTPLTPSHRTSRPSRARRCSPAEPARRPWCRRSTRTTDATSFGPCGTRRTGHSHVRGPVAGLGALPSTDPRSRGPFFTFGVWRSPITGRSFSLVR